MKLDLTIGAATDEEVLQIAIVYKEFLKIFLERLHDRDFTRKELIDHYDLELTLIQEKIDKLLGMIEISGSC